MDRLSAVIAVALVACVACVACEACDSGKDPGPPPARNEGAKTTGGQKVSTDAFCDVHKADDSGPLFALPPTGEVKVAAPATGRWLWLNVWASWCKPCIDEMPRIAKFKDQLGRAGRNVDVAFVSIDETDADVTAFQQAHDGLPHTARLADPKGQAAWFQQLGLDAGSPIPVHIFVAPSGHIRCARAGGVREQDYAAIEKLLGE